MAEKIEDAPVTEAPQLNNLLKKKKKVKSMNFTAAGAPEKKSSAPVKVARADGEWAEEETTVDTVRIGVQVESLKLDDEKVKDEKPVWNKSTDGGESLSATKGNYPVLSANAPVASSSRQTNAPAGVQGIKSERSKFDALQEEEEEELAGPVVKKAPAADSAAARADAAKKAAKKEEKRLEKEMREAALREEAAKKEAAKGEATVTVKVDGKEVADTEIKIDVDACQAKYDGRRKPPRTLSAL
jgi:hypothetical protein